MSRVSVVILTANRRRLLAVCLRALARQTLIPAQLVVVNNGSRDATAEMLSQLTLPFPLTIIDTGEPLGFAEARNRGLLAAAEPFVAFLDDDCEADRHWLERMAGALEANGWVAAGGAILPAKRLPAPAEYHPDNCWAAGLLPADFYGPLGGRRVLPATASLIFRRELMETNPFQELGGALGRGAANYEIGREDAQWWRSLRRAGAPVGVVPRAIVWHHIPAERLNTKTLLERARRDGRAHWSRERLIEEIPSAARDIANAPFAAIQDIYSSSGPARPIVEKHRLWAARQWAFLEAATYADDYEPGPSGRWTLLALESARAIAAVGKAAVRASSATLFHGFRATAPLPTVENPPRRILVILHDFLGDAVLSLPMIWQLSDAFPDSRITIFTGPFCGPLLRQNVPANAFVEESTTGNRGKSPQAAVALHRRLREFAPDAVINAYCHGLNPAPFFFLGNAPVVSWTQDNGLEQRLWGELISHPVEKTFLKAEAAALLDLLAPFGIATTLERPVVTPSSDARERARRIRNEAGMEEGDPYAVLQFEADGRYKNWPQDRTAALILKIAAEGMPVFLSGAKWDRAMARELTGGSPLVHALHGLVNSDETSAMLEGAAFFVGTDSGPAHVAQAVGCPTFVLFGMTEEHRWGPLPADALLGRERRAEDIRAYTMSAAPGNWLPDEMAGLAVNEGMRLLALEDVWEVLKPIVAISRNVPASGQIG
ncbi:hypothetical protein BH09SUM1_BH09SUM1_30290 [soil metagenome]